MNTSNKQLLEFCLAECQEALSEIKNIPQEGIKDFLEKRDLEYGICKLLSVKKYILYDESRHMLIEAGIKTIEGYICETPDHVRYNKKKTIKTLETRIKTLKQALQ